MNSFPMIKTRLHNEHIMAGVLGVLLLYHLPRFATDMSSIVDFIILLAAGLLIDSVASWQRYKRFWCCISGAVTAAIISLLSYGVPIWGRILGVAVALIIGKHLWGGTGKNLFNPAMIGLLPVVLIFKIPFPFFEPTVLLLPTVILSLVFLYIRPYTGIGFLFGSLIAMLISRELTFESIMAYGIFFWAFLIMTDPVTVTPQPVAGLAVSFLAGFCSLFYFPTPIAYITVVLAVNLYSGTVDRIVHMNAKSMARLRLPTIYKNYNSSEQAIDLTKPMVESGNQSDAFGNQLDVSANQLDASNDLSEDWAFDKEIVLKRIRDNAVFGMGGSGFTTFKKIQAVMDADTNDKFLIINGAECDPGLIHDKWLLKHHYDEIVQGVEILKTCIPFCDIYLAVKKTTAVDGDKLKLKKLNDIYPVGAERILIKKVLSRNLSHGELPSSAGILVLNVQTVYAITQAVLYNKPVDTRYLTVADLGSKTARVVRVRLGMKLGEVMNAVYPGAVNIYAGGGIMQAHVAEDNDHVEKTVNFIATGPFPSYKESPQCSRCGICIQCCPVGLRVNVIADLVEQGKLKETTPYRVKDCISCGSCSYSCLAGRNLAAKVKHAKEA